MQRGQSILFVVMTCLLLVIASATAGAGAGQDATVTAESDTALLRPATEAQGLAGGSESAAAVPQQARSTSAPLVGVVGFVLLAAGLLLQSLFKKDDAMTS